MGLHSGLFENIRLEWGQAGVYPSKALYRYPLIGYLPTLPEAVFLLVCDPSMNEL
jgi:hypothetical protein